MRKVKNVVISLLLVTVISIGLSSTIFAATRAGYIQCNEKYGRFVPDERMPYVEVYACYTGYNMDSYFQTGVALNYNNTGMRTAYGAISKSLSYASITQRPAYANEYFEWSQQCEIID